MKMLRMVCRFGVPDLGCPYSVIEVNVFELVT